MTLALVEVDSAVCVFARGRRHNDENSMLWAILCTTPHSIAIVGRVSMWKAYLAEILTSGESFVPQGVPGAAPAGTALAQWDAAPSSHACEHASACWSR